MSADLIQRLRARVIATQWKRGIDVDYPVAFEFDALSTEAATELERLTAEVERYKAVLHRMLEAPTTQISVTWKDAVRKALVGHAPDRAAIDAARGAKHADQA